jgi:hypothetical protein
MPERSLLVRMNPKLLCRGHSARNIDYYLQKWAVDTFKGEFTLFGRARWAVIIAVSGFFLAGLAHWMIARI